jgi:hypothetical protein
VQSFLEEPGAQVVAACDIDSDLETAQNINTKYGNQDCKTYVSSRGAGPRRYRAVMLAVPDPGTASSGRGRGSGKRRYGEKPLAQSAAEG